MLQSEKAICMKERLKIAYENVSFFADGTWIRNSFQKHNLELHFAENFFKNDKLSSCKPRSVQKNLRESKLAMWCKHCSHTEKLDMSSSPSELCTDYVQIRNENGEVWELPDVDDLFGWFSQTDTETEPKYESPLMKTHCFQEGILKLKIIDDRCKDCWSSDGLEVEDDDNGPRSEGTQSRGVTICKDFEQLKDLSEIFKEQTQCVAEVLGKDDSEDTPDTKLSPKISYSEVLKGLTKSKKMSNKSILTMNFRNNGDYPKNIEQESRECFYPKFKAGPGSSSNSDNSIPPRYRKLYPHWLQKGDSAANNEKGNKVVEGSVKDEMGEDVTVEAGNDHDNLDGDDLTENDIAEDIDQVLE